MARVPDLYGLLGVNREATDDEIKRAYRKLARELHPDVNGDPEVQRRFKEITAAYDTLKDPGKRRRYDLFGAAGAPGQAPDFFNMGDMGDLFDVFFGGGMGGAGRRRSRRRARTERGPGLQVLLTLSFEEAVFGVAKDVDVDTLEQCTRCGGTGCEPGTHPSRCTGCGGSGEMQNVSRSMFGTVMTARPCTVCDGTGEEIAARHGAKVKVVEVPPGPPVLSPLVAEIYGPDEAGRHAEALAAAVVLVEHEPDSSFADLRWVPLAGRVLVLCHGSILSKVWSLHKNRGDSAHAPG